MRRAARRLHPSIAALVVLALLVTATSCGGERVSTESTTATATDVAPTSSLDDVEPDLGDHVLDEGELPDGWQLGQLPDDGHPTCGSTTTSTPAPTDDSLTVAFTDGTSALFEVLSWHPKDTASYFAEQLAAFESCSAPTIVFHGETLHGTVTHLPMPTIGDESQAFHQSYQGDGTTLSYDLIYVREGDYVADIIIGTTEPSSGLDLAEIARAAVLDIDD